MKSWRVLSSERYGNGYRNVLGSDNHLRIAPFYGEQPWSDNHLRAAPFYDEQPWMGAPKRSSLFPKWPMMIVVSETQRLSFMDFCTCSLKWNWFQWKVSICKIQYSYMNDAMMLTALVLSLLVFGSEFWFGGFEFWFRWFKFSLFTCLHGSQLVLIDRICSFFLRDLCGLASGGVDLSSPLKQQFKVHVYS